MSMLHPPLSVWISFVLKFVCSDIKMATLVWLLGPFSQRVTNNSHCLLVPIIFVTIIFSTPFCLQVWDYYSLWFLLLSPPPLFHMVYFFRLKFPLVPLQSWVCRQILFEFGFILECLSVYLVIGNFAGYSSWAGIYGLRVYRTPYRPFWLLQSPLRSYALFQYASLHMLFVFFLLKPLIFLL